MESAGLWLVGIGALLLALVGLAGGQVRLALTFGGAGDRRIDRVKFAVSGAGLLATAAGSALIAISSMPSLGFVIATIAALVVIVYVLLAWRVHTLWREHLAAVAASVSVNQDSRRELWRLDAARSCARWRWALSHPLSTADAISWPMAHLERQLGPCPVGPPESPEDPRIAMKLRQNFPNVARAVVSQLPGWTHDVALIARDCDWTILRSEHTVALFTPDGTRSVTASIDTSGATVHALRRHQLLSELAEQGLPTHRGARGQLAPGRDRGHLLDVLAQAGRDEQQDLTSA